MASSLVVAKKSDQQHQRLHRGEPCWLFDAGPEAGFQMYSQSIQADLEGALKAQRQLCLFNTTTHHYQVDLETMVQRNIKTGTERAVVRLLLTTTHAILDRDTARIFPLLSYKEIVPWITKHATEPVSIDRKLLNKGALMTKATTLFHSSKEFPVLLRSDGTPYPIKNKAGKAIQGGAKPTVLNVVPVPKPSPKTIKIIRDKEWAMKLVTRTDCAKLAARIVSVDDLTESCSALYAQFRAFKLLMPKESKELVAFHGTTSAAASKIIQSGFDWRYNERHVYGKGNYFSTNAGYAIGIAPTESSVKTIIVANIIYFKVAKGTSSMTLPPEGFDTTVDDESSPNIFVTYKVCSSFV